ncbi:MAG: hypothetical protein MPI95_03770 [Nitrosopumilus sp.]|nr:hypothetical protein [Nitrosopumilus sp.]CAI9830846.1 exported hypothetical protein [Nitrosopumilaceae archaeon]MDA7941101.1 hypothetical protein [Nitrosopumilus sp.]MDA7942501.1 hypothetical protein [Nitrosopumilus sp.]MDA7944540.1 hypothetical protein [Nitrosopumilus sp.]
MIVKICVVVVAIAAAGIILADWLNPAAGSDGAPVDAAMGIADSVYGPFVRAAEGTYAVFAGLAGSAQEIVSQAFN